MTSHPTTIAELVPGMPFRTSDGRLFCRGNYGPDGQGDDIRCRVLGSDGEELLSLHQQVTPIDLSALLRDHDAVLRMIHDLREEHAPWLEEGAARERQEIIDLVGWMPLTNNARIIELIRTIEARGPLLPPLHPDVMRANLAAKDAEIARMQTVLLKIGDFAAARLVGDHHRRTRDDDLQAILRLVSEAITLPNDDDTGEDSDY